MVPRALAVRAGEMLTAGHGLHRVALLVPAGSPLSLPSFNLELPSLIQRPELAHIHSSGVFAKRPL